MVCMNALGHQKDLKKDCKMYRFCHNNTIFVLKYKAAKENTNERALIVKITAKFHDITDTLFINQSKTQLIVIKGPLEDLISYLKKAEKQLGNDFKGLKRLEDV